MTFLIPLLSLARRMSRNCSRSLSSADEYPHDPSPRTASPASLRDHFSLFADNVGDFIRNLRIIRTYRLILKSNMYPRLKVRFLRMTWDF